jgi:hypothetical protein
LAHRQPLRVIRFVGSKEGIERIVSGNNKTRDVGQELTTEVEDDKEKV